MNVKYRHQWGAIGLILVMSLNQFTSTLAAATGTATVQTHLEAETDASSSDAKNENSHTVNKDRNHSSNKESTASSSNADSKRKRSNHISIQVENVTAGGLEAAVTEALEAEDAEDPGSVTALKISGDLDESDFSYIRFNFSNLATLDLEEISNTTMPDYALKNSNTEGDVESGTLYSLKELYLPEHMTEIGEGAFQYCRSLGDVDLSNIEVIGTRAFDGCYKFNIKDGILNPALTEIPEAAFTMCRGIKELDLSHVSTLGERAFDGCTNLTLIDSALSTELATILPYTFSSCSNLGTVDLSHVTQIGHHAFSVSGVRIKDGVLNPALTEISEGTFFSCRYLDIIDLSNVNSISREAFHSNPNLKVMILPSVRPSIDSSALRYVPALMLLVENEQFYNNFSDFPDGSGKAYIGGSDKYEVSNAMTLELMPNVGDVCSYQWYYEDELLTGETSRILSMTDVQESDSGTYKCEVTAAGYTFEFTKDITVSPLPLYTLTTTATEGGTVSSGGVYKKGTSCTVTATADENYRFAGWTENGYWINEDAIYTFTLKEDRDLIARFERETVRLNLISGSGGYAYTDGYYDKGTICTIVAVPSSTHKFVNWTMDGVEVSQDISYSFTISSDCTLTANFEYRQSTLTVQTGGGGTVTPGGTFNRGTYCKVQATPDAGYNFVKWTMDGDEVSTNPVFSLILEDDCILIAHFKEKEMAVLTVSAGRGGEVSTGGTYEAGSICAVKATTSNGYKFINWTIDGNEISTEDEFVFYLYKDINLLANFEKIKTSSSGSGGGSRTLTITAKTGNWIQNDTGWWYQYQDGSYPQEEWVRLNDSWYYFNQDGYMVTGWNCTNEQWYWLDETTGKMATDSWITYQDNRYYLGSDGVITTGWLKQNDVYYYFSEVKDKHYGRMLRNEVTPDGYYINQDGILVP